MMFRLFYFPVLLYHLFCFSIINRSLGLLAIILTMLCFSLIIVAAQISAPFIYTLF